MVLLNNSGLIQAQISNYFSLIKSMFEIQKFKTFQQIDVPIITKQPDSEEEEFVWPRKQIDTVPPVSGGMLWVEKDKEKKRNIKFQRKTLSKKKKEESSCKWGSFQTAFQICKASESESSTEEEKAETNPQEILSSKENLDSKQTNVKIAAASSVVTTPSVAPARCSSPTKLWKMSE